MDDYMRDKILTQQTLKAEMRVIDNYLDLIFPFYQSKGEMSVEQDLSSKRCLNYMSQYTNIKKKIKNYESKLMEARNRFILLEFQIKEKSRVSLK